MSKQTTILFAVIVTCGFIAVVASVFIASSSLETSISEPNSACPSVLVGMADARQNFNENPGVKGVAHQQFWQDRYNSLSILAGVWNCDFTPTSIFD